MKAHRIASEGGATEKPQRVPVNTRTALATGNGRVRCCKPERTAGSQGPGHRAGKWLRKAEALRNFPKKPTTFRVLLPPRKGLALNGTKKTEEETAPLKAAKAANVPELTVTEPMPEFISGTGPEMLFHRAPS